MDTTLLQGVLLAVVALAVLEWKVFPALKRLLVAAIDKKLEKKRLVFEPGGPNSSIKP